MSVDLPEMEKTRKSDAIKSLFNSIKFLLLIAFPLSKRPWTRFFLKILTSNGIDLSVSPFLEMSRTSLGDGLFSNALTIFLNPYLAMI